MSEVDRNTIIQEAIADLEKAEVTEAPEAKEPVEEKAEEEQVEAEGKEEESQEEPAEEQEEEKAEASEEEEEKPEKKTSDVAKKAREERERRQEVIQLKKAHENLSEKYNALYNHFALIKKDPVAWLEQNFNDDIYQKWTLRKMGQGEKQEEKVTPEQLEAVREEYQAELRKRDAAIQAQKDAQAYCSEVNTIVKDIEDLSDLEEYVTEADLGTSFYQYVVDEATTYAKDCVAKGLEYDLPADELVETVAAYIRKQIAAAEKVKSKKSKKAEEEEKPSRKAKPKTLTSQVKSTQKEKVYKSRDDIIADAIASLG